MSNTTITPERLLAPAEAGAMLGIAVQTLANWRSATPPKGPRSVLVGARARRYKLSDLLAYIEGLETVEAEAA